MVTAETAIDRASEFLKGLKSEYIGTIEDNSIRLETIQFFPNEWIVVLSYLTKTPRQGESALNPLLEALSYQRYYKEFEIDSTTGKLVAMRNPHEHESTTRVAS